MIRSYIGIIDKDKNSDYGVMFPDFLGCVSAGKTIEELKMMAKEALKFHIDGMIEDGEEIPESSNFNDIITKNNNSVFFVVKVKI